MVEIAGVLTRWGLDVRQVRDRMYRAPTPRERERWQALWLLAQGWSASKVAELVERDVHIIGAWLAAFAQDGPAALAFEQTGGPPPALDPEAQAGLKVAVQATPGEVGIALANWNWQVVRQFIEDRCGVRLCRGACTRYLHRLGFAYKRPKKRPLKADDAKRAAFVAEYVAQLAEARASGARIFFADEAHFRADADLHGKWVLRGHPALVDSTCPRWGEKASYSSAVCLETGAVEHMELSGTSSSATSAAFLRQLRANHPGPLVVIWDNGPARGGEGDLGLGARGGHRQHRPGQQGRRAGADAAVLRRPAGPRRRGPIPLPPHAAGAGRGPDRTRAGIES
jgi:transposase